MARLKFKYEERLKTGSRLCAEMDQLLEGSEDSDELVSQNDREETYMSLPGVRGVVESQNMSLNTYERGIDELAERSRQEQIAYYTAQSTPIASAEDAYRIARIFTDRYVELATSQ